MKRIIISLGVSFLAVIVSVIGILIFKQMHQKRIFYEQAFEQMRDGRGDNPMITLAFEDGGSASVILEHSCCTGAGFDAVAIRTSDGQEYVADKNYCGIAGFQSELNTDSIKSLSMFSAFLEERGYGKR
jgi:hypothetical protein